MQRGGKRRALLLCVCNARSARHSLPLLLLPGPTCLISCVRVCVWLGGGGGGRGDAGELMERPPSRRPHEGTPPPPHTHTHTPPHPHPHPPNPHPTPPTSDLGSSSTLP
jgi:hypothetical protein